MTSDDLRQLDAEVAERVMGEPMPPTPTDCVDPFNDGQLSPQRRWVHVHVYDHGDTSRPIESRSTPV